MTTIKSWLNSYSLDSYMKENYYLLKAKGVLVQQEIPYNSETIYNYNDKITVQDNNDYMWYFYVSKENNNTGHQYTDTDFWQKGNEIKNIYTNNDFATNKKIAENLNFFALKENISQYHYKQLILLCLSANLMSFVQGVNPLLANASSIDGMSVSGEMTGFFKKFPWLNNPFGVQYLVLRSQLIGLDDIYGLSYYAIPTIGLQP